MLRSCFVLNFPFVPSENNIALVFTKKNKDILEMLSKKGKKKRQKKRIERLKKAIKGGERK